MLLSIPMQNSSDVTYSLKHDTDGQFQLVVHILIQFVETCFLIWSTSWDKVSVIMWQSTTPISAAIRLLPIPLPDYVIVFHPETWAILKSYHLSHSIKTADSVMTPAHTVTFSIYSVQPAQRPDTYSHYNCYLYMTAMGFNLPFKLLKHIKL